MGKQLTESYSKQKKKTQKTKYSLDPQKTQTIFFVFFLQYFNAQSFKKS